MKYLIGLKDLENARNFIDDYNRAQKQKNQQNNTFSLITTKEIRELISAQESNEPFQDTLHKMIDKYKDTYQNYQEFANLTNIHVDTLRKYRNGIRTIPRRDLFKIIITLKCNENDALFLMEKAGYSFNKTNKTDLVVLCHIQNKEYDRSNIDENLLHEGEIPLFEYIEYNNK